MEEAPFERSLEALAAGELGFEAVSNEAYKRAKAPSRALFDACTKALLSENVDVLAVGAAGLSWLAKKGPEWGGDAEVAALLAQTGRGTRASSSRSSATRVSRRRPCAPP